MGHSGKDLNRKALESMAEAVCPTSDRKQRQAQFSAMSDRDLEAYVDEQLEVTPPINTYRV